ncbi:MAG: helix-turn-helix transcriptional regulator [Jejuia sp.]
MEQNVLILEDIRQRLSWLQFIQTYPRLGIYSAYEAQEVWRILKAKSISFLVWIPNENQKLSSKIKKRFPSLKWIIVCTQKNLIDVYKWRKRMQPKAIWWVGDLLKIDYCYFFRNSNRQHLFLSPSLQTMMDIPQIRLSKRELKLLKHLAGGCTPEELAELLHWSPSSVLRHKKRIKEYFDIPNGNDCKLIYEAQKRGYI